MSLLQIKWVAIFVIFTTNPATIKSQLLVPDTGSSPAVKHAVTLYNNSLRQQFHIYNGPEYHDYPYTFEHGQPYFIQKVWSKGTVDYDGSLYEDVSILYDAVTDKVIILANNRISKIELLKERVRSFSLLGHSFVHITADSMVSQNLTPGFYDLLVQGKTDLLAKRTKSIQATAKNTLEYNVLSKDYYYLKNSNSYIRVDSKKSILKQVGSRRKEIRTFIKQHKLRFGKETGNTLTEVVKYYNQLI